MTEIRAGTVLPAKRTPVTLRGILRRSACADPPDWLIGQEGADGGGTMGG